MWALRAQTDKLEYAREMRRLLERIPNLDIREGMAVDIELGPNDEVRTSTIKSTRPGPIIIKHVSRTRSS